MVFPKTEVVYQNLSTEYTDVPDLLATLRSKGFAGIVEVALPENTGVFLVSDGKLLTAAVEAHGGPPIMVGDKALEELVILSSSKSGALNVYRLAPRQVECIASRLGSEVVFKGLSTDFVKLDRFIEKLEAEKHDGFVDVFTKLNQPMGTLFLREGALVDLERPDETAAPCPFEEKSILEFLEFVIKEGAIFDVHKSHVERPLQEPRQAAPKWTIAVREGQEECIEEAAPPEEPKGLVEDKPAFTENNGRQEAMGALQEIIAKMEMFVDTFSQEGIFIRAFKRALIEKTDTYPFLDPFADQFDYREGKIILDKEVDLEQFVEAITESFNLTLSHLAKEFPKNMSLPPFLKTELESAFHRYERILSGSGVQSVPPFCFK